MQAQGWASWWQRDKVENHQLWVVDTDVWFILDAHACVQYRTSDMQKGDGCISQALHDIGLKFMHSI